MNVSKKKISKIQYNCFKTYKCPILVIHFKKQSLNQSKRSLYYVNRENNKQEKIILELVVNSNTTLIIKKIRLNISPSGQVVL